MRDIAKSEEKFPTPLRDCPSRTPTVSPHTTCYLYHRFPNGMEYICHEDLVSLQELTPHPSPSPVESCLSACLGLGHKLKTSGKVMWEMWFLAFSFLKWREALRKGWGKGEVSQITVSAILYICIWCFQKIFILLWIVKFFDEIYKNFHFYNSNLQLFHSISLISAPFLH